VPELLARRPADERAKYVQRMRGDFDTLKIARMIKTTPTRSAVLAPSRTAPRGTFTFDFDERARSGSRNW
jgi:hypothetical protein